MFSITSRSVDPVICFWLKRVLLESALILALSCWNVLGCQLCYAQYFLFILQTNHIQNKYVIVLELGVVHCAYLVACLHVYRLKQHLLLASTVTDTRPNNVTILIVAAVVTAGVVHV